MHIPGESLHLAGVARIMAAPLRVRLLARLVHGQASVSDLAGLLHADRRRVSYHLAELRKARLVRPTVRGRLWVYRTSHPRLGGLLTMMKRFPPARVRPVVATTRGRLPGDVDLRQTRTCYDHLAGSAGVYLLQEFLRRRWLSPRADGDGRSYRLTTRGARALVQRGVNVFRAARLRRRFAFACPDWLPPHPHLGGALGAAVLEQLLRERLLVPVRQPRGLILRHPLGAWLGRAR